MYKLRKKHLTTTCNEKNLKIYLKEGWELVREATPIPQVSNNFQNLTKAQLQDLCREKGIKFKQADNKEVLRNKLDVVNNKTLYEKSASNKDFTDALIKDE